MGKLEDIHGDFSRPLMGKFEANGGKIDEINGQFRGH